MYYPLNKLPRSVCVYTELSGLSCSVMLFSCSVCVCQPPPGQALLSGCEAAGQFTPEMFIIMKSKGHWNVFDALGLHDF